MSDLWVFGYGSLMWRPGFAYVEAATAVVSGAHRALCIRSVHHRGTMRRPGLVLGLDLGGRCHGVAFRVTAGQRRAVLAYLQRREQVTGVYRRVQRRVLLADGREVQALCFGVNRRHWQYAGALPVAMQAALVRRRRGRSGHNLAYVQSTIAHLRAAGIHDAQLERLAARLPRG